MLKTSGSFFWLASSLSLTQYSVVSSVVSSTLTPGFWASNLAMMASFWAFTPESQDQY